MAWIRLDKYLADMQVGTRSQVKEKIKKGRVVVDGVTITRPEEKIDGEQAIVSVDGIQVNYSEYEYYMLHKPAGVLTATMDKKQKTVIDLLDKTARKDLFPVGRLDKDTEGLLLITNDGALAHDLLAPKKHVDKQYYAKVKGMITQKHIEAFAKGVVIDGEYQTMPAVLEIVRAAADMSEILVTIREGKFHQIKKMFLATGSEVLYLKRLAMGTLRLDETLEAGAYRPLTEEELADLQRITKKAEGLEKNE